MTGTRLRMTPVVTIALSALRHGILRTDLESTPPGYEQCDDGNTDDDDGCLSNCVSATCGDGFVGPDEECDDGNEDNDDAP